MFVDCGFTRANYRQEILYINKWKGDKYMSFDFAKIFFIFTTNSKLSFPPSN